MIVFHEKADQVILNQCKTFIQMHSTSKADYFVFSEALQLYTKLSQSMLESHKDFDDIIVNNLGKDVSSLISDLTLNKFAANS